MAAKIIPFPGNARASMRGAQRANERERLDIAIELVDTAPTLPYRASLSANDTLADLHRLITGLFRWDGDHNYFFSHGSCRYEDPVLFRSQDRIAARCRKIYCAADVPVGAVLGAGSPPLFYMYNLTCGWELRISRADDITLEQFG